MRILHTESSVGWGGQENRTINEMVAMRERGHDMAVASRPGARILERAKEAGFACFVVDMRGAADFPAIFRLRRLMRDFRADIVNTHSGRDTQLAGMAGHLLGRRPRIVRTRHLALPITSRFSYNVLTDRVVAVSKFVRDYLVSAGVRAAQVEAVPTGIDLGRYGAASAAVSLREELGLPADTVLIGTVAILRVKKGHADLLRAVPDIFTKFPGVHFVIAGDGPQTGNLQKLIAELGLESRVHMLGLRRDVTNILQSLDIFVLPTHQEALGTAFIEAGATGLPVVATAVDGVPEVVVDGETGILVPARDVPALSGAISRLLGDSQLRRCLGEAARRRVGREFSREVMAERMERLYLDLLAS